nr:MAG TPA: hypothetical protein [Caudoviricetes sp.]
MCEYKKIYSIPPTFLEGKIEKNQDRRAPFFHIKFPK